jgi:hypothetical protein
VRDWSSDATPAADRLRVAPELGQKLPKAVRADMIAALASPAGADSSDVGAVLFGAIRSAARRSGSIGTHCMTVCIARWQEVRIRFNRDAASSTHAYSPWILGRGFMFPPTTSNAGPGTHTWQDESGHEHSITYEVDPPFQAPGIRWSGSQERTTWSPSSSEKG